MEHASRHAGARLVPRGAATGGVERRGSSLTLEDIVAAALRADYGIEPTRLEITERGKDFAASVFRVSVAGSGPRFVVKTRPADAPRDVAAAIARYLADAGVQGVVAPIPSLTGSVAARSGSVSLTVYPFIDGRLGIEMEMADASWRALGAFARRLHATTLPEDLADAVPRESYRPAEIDTIARVDAAVRDAPSPGDDTAARVVDLWHDHRDEILALATRTAALGDALRARSLPLVTCHADTHTGNLIVDPAGAVWVIDWDEVVLAPKERDLMFSVGGGISTELVDANATTRYLEGYGDVDIDEQALAYYRHAWAVQDVGGYAWRVLLDGSANVAQRKDAADILIGLFRPGEIVDLAARTVA
ncbi:MAG: phosphotransferase [Chloroflexota bacterium]